MATFTVDLCRAETLLQAGRRQFSFSTIWDGFETNEAAKFARDSFYRDLKRRGFKVRRWVLKNQLRE